LAAGAVLLVGIFLRGVFFKVFSAAGLEVDSFFFFPGADLDFFAGTGAMGDWKDVVLPLSLDFAVFGLISSVVGGDFFRGVSLEPVMFPVDFFFAAMDFTSFNKLLWFKH